MIAADDVHTVAVIGAGALGAGWVTLALHRGFDVIAIDPRPEAAAVLLRTVARQSADLEAQRTSPAKGSLEIQQDIAAASSADLVLESGPEDLNVKHEIFGALDALTRPEVLLCSSSSGLMPSAIQLGAAHHPERVLVTHPFNPTHLMPVVEVVPGRMTSEAATTTALQFLRRLGKQPIPLRAELPGHVVNRLQAALWREAYHLVEAGAVSLRDLDTAVAGGPGLRWALLGPFATQHLSGLPSGISHILEHLGPPMEQWWDDLGTPRLTESLKATIVAGVEDEMRGVDIEMLVRQRDAALGELIRLKDRAGLSDGERASHA